jgi:hypothetical protein
MHFSDESFMKSCSDVGTERANKCRSGKETMFVAIEAIEFLIEISGIVFGFKVIFK